MANAVVEERSSSVEQLKGTEASQVGLEIFSDQLELILKKIESRQGGTSGTEYLMLSFSMCVKFDPKNVRENRFLNVPIYCPVDVARKAMQGMKKGEPLDKKWLVAVEFTPSLYKGRDGLMYTNFRAEVTGMVLSDDTVAIDEDMPY